MKIRWIAAFAAIALFCVPTRAQVNPTSVTATIVDSNSTPYFPATVQACLTPVTTDPVVNGVHVNPNPGTNYCLPVVNTNSAGTFQVGLFPNGSITPAATQWSFFVSASGAAPPSGKGPQNFTSAITISGTSQSVSATLSAAAPVLLNGASSGGGTTPVATFPTTCTAGAQYYITGSGQTVACGANNNVVMPGTPGNVNPTAYGAKYSGHMSSIPSFTNTSNIVTATDANFTGTDQYGRPIAKVGQYVFGSNVTTDVSQATSAFITATCVIQSIDSATQIHMGTVAVPANPCNATASTTTSGFIIWGDLDSNTTGGGAQTAGNDPIFGAWTAAAAGCIPYHHPAGITIIERQEWNTYPASGGCGNANGILVTRRGFTITGEGSNASIVIPDPSFNYTQECVGPNAGSVGCFASLPNPTYHDWQIWGAGNSAGGLNGKSAVLVFGISPGVNFEIDRMQFNGLGAATAGFKGLNIGNDVASSISGGTLARTNVEAFGSTNCYIGPGATGTFIATIFADSLWCTVGSANLIVNGGVFSSVNGIYGWTLVTFGSGLGAAFICQAGSYCNSTNDTMPYNGTAAGAAEFYCFGNGSPSQTRCNIENDTINTTVSNGVGLVLLGGAAGGAPTVQLNNTIINAPFAIFTSTCSTSTCKVNSVGGNIYTATTTGYTPSSGASLWLSPTDQLTGFGTTVQTGITGTGACSTVSTETAVTTTGIVTCTAVGGAATLVFTPLFTAPHGWYCAASDQTTAADTFKQTASSTTTCTVSAAAVVQNDVVSFNATPY